MHTVIFGSKGQLARDLAPLFTKGGSVTGFDLPEVDISREEHVADALAGPRPDLIINAAAYNDVEGAEDDAEGAFGANEHGARHVAEAARRLGVPVVFYSTDFVFWGESPTPHEPGDPVNPRGVYARSKAAGEAATRAATPRHFILRTAWLYGPGGNNFVEKILRAATTRPVLRVVADEVGSPTHTRDLAEATTALWPTGAYGTYHAANAGSCSRYEFARAIVAKAGLATRVDPCPAADYPSKVSRPPCSILSTRTLTEACGYEMQSWKTRSTRT